MKFDVVVIGGGHCGMQMATSLQKEGKKCVVISKGRSLYGLDDNAFKAAGGRLLMGDEVCGYTLAGGRVKEVFTKNLGEVGLQAEVFYLATGKFFAGGLVADMEKVYEPIFGLDTVYEQDPGKWFGEKFSDSQPFMEFGVATSKEGCAIVKGQEITNLFPIGEIKAR